MLTVPCDTPFSAGLGRAHGSGCGARRADIAMAAAPEEDGVRSQPVFCLLHVDLLAVWRPYPAGGARLTGWTGQHYTVLVPFDQPRDDPRASLQRQYVVRLGRH